MFRFHNNLLIPALADNWKHIIVKFMNLTSFYVLSYNVIEINIFKRKKCNVFMIRVVFNKQFDIIPSSPEDDVSKLRRKLGTN